MKKPLQIAQVQGSDEDGDQVVLKTAIKQVLEFFTADYCIRTRI